MWNDLAFYDRSYCGNGSWSWFHRDETTRSRARSRSGGTRVKKPADPRSKEGVVVDIRNNNGGFINVYVTDILARRGCLTMKERGLWNVPARTALGQRSLELPTILVTNQHSL